MKKEQKMERLEGGDEQGKQEGRVCETEGAENEFSEYLGTPLSSKHVEI